MRAAAARPVSGPLRWRSRGPARAAATPSRPTETPPPRRRYCERSKLHSERQKGGIGCDEIGPGEEHARQIHADGSRRHAEPDARPGQSLVYESVAAAHSHHLAIADVHAEANVGVPGLAPRALDVGGHAEVEAVGDRVVDRT